jgi:hypothetical protein
MTKVLGQSLGGIIVDKKIKSWAYPILALLITFVVVFIPSYLFTLAGFDGAVMISVIVDIILAGYLIATTPNRKVRELANVMGLELHRNFSGRGSLKGDYRDHQVKINFISGHEGTSGLTDFEVKCQNLSKIDMSISREWSGSKLMKKLGSKDIEIGIPEFDKKFIIGGHPETDINFILDPSIQQKIQSLGYFSYLRLYKNKVTSEVNGNVTSEITIKKFLEVMVDIAERVEGKEPSTDTAIESDQKRDIYHPSSENPEKIKFCPECGTENIANAQFCENCGQKL